MGQDAPRAEGATKKPGGSDPTGFKFLVNYKQGQLRTLGEGLG